MRQEALQFTGISAEEAARVHIAAEINFATKDGGNHGHSLGPRPSLRSRGDKGGRDLLSLGRGRRVDSLDGEESGAGRAITEQFRLLIFRRRVECLDVFQ
jgi:hypothetical protein